MLIIQLSYIPRYDCSYCILLKFTTDHKSYHKTKERRIDFFKKKGSISCHFGRDTSYSGKIMFCLQSRTSVEDIWSCCGREDTWFMVWDPNQSDWCWIRYKTTADSLLRSIYLQISTKCCNELDKMEYLQLPYVKY